MKRQRSHAVIPLVAGSASLLVPMIVWFARNRIIAWLAPDDPAPQNAMAIVGLIWFASIVVFGLLGLALLIHGFSMLARSSKDELPTK